MKKAVVAALLALAVLFAAGTAFAAHDVYIGEMEFEHGNELKIELVDAAGRDDEIRWDRQEKITVTDAEGKAYPVRVREYDKDEIELVIDGLTSGQKYTIELRGILCRGQKITLTGDFMAIHDWEYKDPRTH